MARVQQRPRVRARAGAGRGVSTGGGVRSAHALSFGAHYDPDRTSWGALVAHNDDVLDPGTAYGPHDHRDVEILAWVRSGRLRHTGPDGAATVVAAGGLQHLAAGTGWHHDEAADGDEPLHVLQLWIAPGLDDPPAEPPALAHATVPSGGGAVLAAAGERAVGPREEPLLRLRRPDAAVVIVRLVAGQWYAPSPEPAAWRHVHVVAGAVAVVAGEGAAGEGAAVDGAGEGVAAEGMAAEGVAGEGAGGSRETAVVGDSLEIAGPGPLPLVAGPDGAELLVVATL